MKKLLLLFIPLVFFFGCEKETAKDDSQEDVYYYCNDNGECYSSNQQLGGSYTTLASCNNACAPIGTNGFGTVGYLAANTKLYKTTNSGYDWTEVCDFSILFGIQESFTTYTTYFVNETTGYFFHTSAGLFKTTDSGQTWNLVSNIIEQIDPNDFTYWLYPRMSFVNETTGYLVFRHSVLFKTTDSGQTWEGIYSWNDYPATRTSDIFVESQSTVYILCSDQNKLYKTTNSAISWTEVCNFYSDLDDLDIVSNSNERQLCFAKDDADYVYVVDNDKHITYQSNNGAETWTELRDWESAFGANYNPNTFDSFMFNDISVKSMCFPHKSTGYFVDCVNRRLWKTTWGSVTSYPSLPTGISCSNTSIYFF